MKRMLVPVGQFVEAYNKRLDPNRMKGKCFTVTAYDPVMGQFIAIGHSCPALMVGNSVYKADGIIPDTGENVAEIKARPNEMIGIVTRQAPLGVSGPFYGEVGEAMLTDTAKVGKARLLTSLLPEGGMEVEIASVDAFGNFKFKADKRCVGGMSGSPVVQNGNIVGVFWGVTKLYEGRAVETVADKLLDAWANNPKENPKVRERDIRRAAEKATRESAERMAKSVGERFGPEVAERVKKIVLEQGPAAATKIIRDLRKKGVLKDG